MNYSLGGPLSYGSPVVVFLYRGHPCFWNFYSTVPVDAVRVKSYEYRFFDTACVTVRITIDKLYLISVQSGWCTVSWAWSETPIHIRLHPANINRDSRIEITKTWMPKKQNNSRAEGTTITETASIEMRESQLLKTNQSQ